jgi:hypothetical protein
VLARPAGRVTGGGTGVVDCGVTGVDGSVGVAAVNVVVDGGAMSVVVEMTNGGDVVVVHFRLLDSVGEQMALTAELLTCIGACMKKASQPNAHCTFGALPLPTTDAFAKLATSFVPCTDSDTCLCGPPMITHGPQRSGVPHKKTSSRRSTMEMSSTTGRLNSVALMPSSDTTVESKMTDSPSMAPATGDDIRYVDGLLCAVHPVSTARSVPPRTRAPPSKRNTTTASQSRNAVNSSKDTTDSAPRTPPAAT